MRIQYFKIPRIILRRSKNIKYLFWDKTYLFSGKWYLQTKYFINTTTIKIHFFGEIKIFQFLKFWIRIGRKVNHKCLPLIGMILRLHRPILGLSFSTNQNQEFWKWQILIGCEIGNVPSVPSTGYLRNCKYYRRAVLNETFQIQKSSKNKKF